MSTAYFWINALGEMLGTLVLVLLGNGVCYATSHSKMFANQPGKWILIAIGWGLAVYAGVIVALSLGGPGHLNPAVSVYASINNHDAKLLMFILFQFIGAMLAQLVLNIINWKFIIETAKTDDKAFRGAHCCNPVYDNFKDKALAYNFLYEFIACGLLLTIVLATGIKNETPNLSHPIQVSFIIMAIGISLGSATGYAINPARDLGPRIMYQLFRPFVEKKANVKLIDANWSYSWVPVIAPLIAGTVIGAFSLLA